MIWPVFPKDPSSYRAENRAWMQGQKQRDQMRDYFHNPGERWWWLGPGWQALDVEWERKSSQRWLKGYWLEPFMLLRKNSKKSSLGGEMKGSLLGLSWHVQSEFPINHLGWERKEAAGYRSRESPPPRAGDTNRGSVPNIYVFKTMSPE